jgi:hypothetical protein
MRHYRVTHEHEFGKDVIVVKSEYPLHLMSPLDVADECDMHYEPDLGEEIYVEEYFIREV